MKLKIHYEKEFETKVREFADSFGFEVVNMKGSPELIEKCYERAKKEALRRGRIKSGRGTAL